MNRLRLIIFAIGALSIVSSCDIGGLGNDNEGLGNDNQGSGCAITGSANDNVKLFYIPFNAETYVPITIENIEQSACVIELDKTSSVVTQFADSVKRAREGRFDNKVVRLKAINLFKNAIFVDRHGGLRFENSEAVLQMEYSDFAETKLSVEEAAKSCGCEYYQP